MATATPPHSPTPIPEPSAPEPLLTAEEFARRGDSGQPEELVRGKIVTMTPPGTRHGWIAFEIGFVIRLFLQEHDLGRVVVESGTITTRNPDTVRGPDVAFYSYAKLPRGPLPAGYPEAPPDLVFEVMSPSDRWPGLLAKVAEYLTDGVAVAVIVDPEAQAVQVYEADRTVRVLGRDDLLTLPAVLPGFEARVGRFLDA